LVLGLIEAGKPAQNAGIESFKGRALRACAGADAGGGSIEFPATRALSENDAKLPLGSDRDFLGSDLAHHVEMHVHTARLYALQKLCNPLVTLWCEFVLIRNDLSIAGLLLGNFALEPRFDFPTTLVRYDFHLV
jgi:hypothetical protein